MAAPSDADAGRQRQRLGQSAAGTGSGRAGGRGGWAGRGLNTRVALIIGNAAYAKAPLKNSVNDARALATNLRGLGFDVTLLENARLETTKAAIAQFSGKVKDGGIALFYFAGHGVQSQGSNYLLPIEASDRLVARSLSRSKPLPFRSSDR